MAAFSGLVKKTFSALAVVLFAVPVIVLTGTPAQADSEACKNNVRTFVVPNDEDPTVTARLCVNRSTDGSKVRACGKITVSGIITNGKKFDHFELALRMEKSDYFMQGLNHAYPTERKAFWDATTTSPFWLCTSWQTVGASAPRVYSADGWVIFDIDGDGLGQQPSWQLTGSPLI